MFILVRVNSVYAATSHLLSHRVLNYPQRFLIWFPRAPHSWSFSKALKHLKARPRAPFAVEFEILKAVLNLNLFFKVKKVTESWYLTFVFENLLYLTRVQSAAIHREQLTVWFSPFSCPRVRCAGCQWTLLCVTEASSDHFWTFIL